ncbi:MAG: class I SAM-dependent methyltransferase [Dehalococcoidales bacterium]|nr:class I SAM-dependent methyltransferase [Dehalococcoidales bacterium]
MRKKLGMIYGKLFPTGIDILKKELAGANTIVDLGCGFNSYLQYVDHGYKVGVDVFSESAKESSIKRIHDEYVYADILEYMPDTRYDVAVLINVVEHIAKSDALRLLARVERYADKILIFTPRGYTFNYHYNWGIDANEYQAHISGWRANDFRQLGYKVRGIGGLPIFYTKYPKYDNKNKVVGSRLRKGFIPITLRNMSHWITYWLPGLAWGLYAVKEVTRQRE